MHIIHECMLIYTYIIIFKWLPLFFRLTDIFFKSESPNTAIFILFSDIKSSYDESILFLN